MMERQLTSKGGVIMIIIGATFPLQRLFDSWVWFRGTVGDYTVIGYELNTTDKRGGYSNSGYIHCR